MSFRNDLNTPLEKLLARGGDSRQTLAGATGLNKYGCSMCPLPQTTTFSSCTASSVSPRGHAAASRMLGHYCALSHDIDLNPVVGEHFNAIRKELTDLLFGDALPVPDILLAPSGTDAELLALAIAHRSGRFPVTNIVVGPTEVGSGTPVAARGHFFDALTPFGQHVSVGTPIDAQMTRRTELVCVSLRDTDGLPRDEMDIDAEVERIVDDRVTAGRQVLLHVVAHSKTGLHAPSGQIVRYLKSVHRERVMVIVDAAQGRFSRRGLKRICKEGHLVLITGSKFFGGPPFAAALLVPPAFESVTRHMAPLPAAYSCFFAQDYFPPAWRHLTRDLPPSGDISLLLRWTAALAEVRAYYATPSRLRVQVLSTFENAVSGILGDSAVISLSKAPEPALGDHERRLLPSRTTVFSFFVRNSDGRFMTFAELRKMWRWLNVDLSSQAGERFSPAMRRVLAQRLHVGQPVRLNSDKHAPAVLRIALGGVMVTDLAQNSGSGITCQTPEPHLADRLIALKRKVAIIAANFDRFDHQQAARDFRSQ